MLPHWPESLKQLSVNMWHNSFLSASYWIMHPSPFLRLMISAIHFSEINLLTYSLFTSSYFFSKTRRNSFYMVMMLSYLWHIILVVVTKRRLCPFLSRDCLAHNMITDSLSNRVFKKLLLVFIWPFSTKTKRPRNTNTDLESDRSPFY